MGKLSGIQIGIIITTLITAGVHASLLFPDTLFLLNAASYLILLVAYFLPVLGRYHNLVRWAFILYTILTIILWVIMGSRIPLAYVTKVDEIVLIILLFLDRNR